MGLFKRAARSHMQDALTRRAKDKGVPHKDDYDPFAVRDPRAERQEAARLAQEAETPPEDVAPSIIRPGREDLARITRPFQEKTGVFDYSYKMPVRTSGVQRYNPPRGVPARSQELLSRPDVFEEMVRGVESGLDVKDWYEAGPLFKSFIDEFGADEGQRRFDQFTAAVAGTSPRSDVGTNVRNASYYYGQAEPYRAPGSNQPPASFADLPPENPQPYGHLAQNLHRSNAEKTLYPGGEGFSEKKNPKPLSFMWNFRGDPNLVTVDTHAFRAPAMIGRDERFLERSLLNEKGATPRNIMEEVRRGDLSMDDAAGRGAFWQSKPQENEYAHWENYYRRIANELGITPAEAQAAGWVGHGARTGLESAPKSFMDFVEERILKTARERNMDPADVWREAIRGQRPLTMNEKLLEGVPGASAVG